VYPIQNPKLSVEDDIVVIAASGQGQWFPKTLVPPLLDSGSQDTDSQGQ